MKDRDVKLMKYYFFPVLIILWFLACGLLIMTIIDYDSEFILSYYVPFILIIAFILMVPFIYYSEKEKMDKWMEQKIDQKKYRSLYLEGIGFLLISFVLINVLLIVYYIERKTNIFFVITGTTFIFTIFFEWGFIRLLNLKRYKLYN